MVPEDLIYFDLETIPDTSRFKEPAARNDSGKDLEKIADSKISDLRSALPKLSMEELKILDELEETGQNRSGAIGSIRAEVRKVLEEHGKWAKRHATNPWKCRIVAHCFYDARSDTKTTVIAKNEEEEKLLLKEWYTVMRHRVRCSWGGARFDDPVILARSIVLGVDGFPIDMSPPWRNTQHLDLSQLMGDTSLKAAAEAIGEPYSVDGSDVWPLWKMKQYEAIADYVGEDVDKLHGLANDILPRVLWK